MYPAPLQILLGLSAFKSVHLGGTLPVTWAGTLLPGPA